MFQHVAKSTEYAGTEVVLARGYRNTVCTILEDVEESDSVSHLQPVEMPGNLSVDLLKRGRHAEPEFIITAYLHDGFCRCVDVLGDGLTDAYTEMELAGECVAGEVRNVKVGESAGFDDYLELPVEVRGTVYVECGVGSFFIPGGDYETVYVVEGEFTEFWMAVFKGDTVIAES